ncbi:PBSX family phage terminase large subunit [Anaerovorax odorimutans]|uniref:PBSX family phage terminase large subunit n=1 Tax=Anaerovorax odorimutans TaxID=109327 RepID=UPI00041C320F|nr:PBSX family phage terminase large subunit [Anaerovorax odorimutans]
MARVKKAIFKFKPFSNKQLKILTWWLPNSPVKDKDGIIADGAIRSGKTVSMALSFVMWAMYSFSEQNFAMCGKTIGSFRRNVLTVLKLMLWSRGYKCKDHRADNLLEVTRKGVTNYFYIFGGKDERSQDLIQGITLAGVFFDEVALMPESFVNQATGRCSVEGSKFWFNCNPNNPYHWFKTNWIDRVKEKNIIYLHFTMDDNFSLSDKIKERYKSMYVGVFFKRFILGLWVAAEGIIYTLFAEEPNDFIIDTLTEPIKHAVIGVDFGGSKSAHSFTLTGFTPGYKKVIILDEYYHNNVKDGRLSPTQLDDAFVDFVKRAKQKYPVYEVYCDSAEQTLIEGFEVAAAKNRLGVMVKNAIKGPINDRIAFYCSLMAQGRFFIYKHCTATIGALSSAVYDSKKLTEDVRLDDGIMNIDSLDSMEYSTESVQSDIMYLNLRR